VINQVFLVGRLGSDPELKTFDSGNAVCNLSVATNSRIKDKENEGAYKDKTEWHRVAVWGGRGKSCNEYLKKGSQVGVIGRIETTKRETEEGTRYYTQIVADDVKFLSSRSGESNRSGSGGVEVERTEEADLPF